LNAIINDWTSQDDHLWKKVCTAAINEIKKICSEYFEEQHPFSAQVRCLPAVSTDQERSFARIKYDDKKRIHMSIRSHEGCQMYRDTILNTGSQGFTLEDMAIIRRMGINEKTNRQIEEEVAQEISKREIQRMETEKERQERRQQRDQEKAERLQGVELETNVESIQKMKGTQLDSNYACGNKITQEKNFTWRKSTRKKRSPGLPCLKIWM